MVRTRRPYDGRARRGAAEMISLPGFVSRKRFLSVLRHKANQRCPFASANGLQSDWRPFCISVRAREATTKGQIGTHPWMCSDVLYHLASGGVERRIPSAHSRRVPAAEAKVLDVAVRLRLRDGVGGLAQLIVNSAIPFKGAAVFLGESRGGNGGGKNHHSGKCFEVGHLSSPFLRVGANASIPIWVRDLPTSLKCISSGSVRAS